MLIFFLDNLAYKLLNLLVFENISCKMSKNWIFSKIIGLGVNCTYEFEVRFIQTSVLRAVWSPLERTFVRGGFITSNRILYFMKFNSLRSISNLMKLAADLSNLNNLPLQQYTLLAYLL